MINVVFTGPAFDNTGHSVVRADLIAACQSTGKIAVMAGVGASTNVLVASRKDTRKAALASQRGIPVLTYPEFFNRYLRDVQIKKGAKPDKYTDVVDQDMLVPDFTEGMDPGDVL